MSTLARIGAVMVIYNPDWSVTGRAVSSLLPQVDVLCVVDNSPEATMFFKQYDKIHYIILGENQGIAVAQNVGIKWLIEHGYDFVLFSDQDSQAPDDVVNKLADGYRLLAEKGIKVGAVGTRAINCQTGKPYPAKSKELGVPQELTGCSKADDLTECYSVISSISLISTISLATVGGFDESLFIDGVDHEWCWRAWHKYQLRSFIVESAKINHMLGEGDRKIGGHNVAIASSFRVYYQYRNFIWLIQRNYVPKYWIKKNLLKYAIKAFYFPIMVSPRLKYLNNIIRGIKDGFNSNTAHKSWPNFQKKNG